MLTIYLILAVVLGTIYVNAVMGGGSGPRYS